MDKLRAMEVFVVAAEAGSFAAAAQRLAISPVMVGKYIRAIEEQLQARLLDRSTRRQRLTEVGAAYLERCRDVVASVSQADHVAERMRAQPQGTLRITAPVAYGAHSLMPVIAAYMAAHPQVRVELNLNDRVVDLAEEGFDCGVRSGPVADDGLVVRPLAPARLMAVASPAFVQEHGMPAHPCELSALPLLAFAAWGPAACWRFTRGDTTVRVPVKGSLVANSAQALLAAATAGAGVIVQADTLLAPALRARQVVQLLPEWSLPSRPVQIVRLPEARPSAKLRSFVDFVVDRLGA